jgi:hypothetical protein
MSQGEKMTDKSAPKAEDLVIYRTVITIPGQSFTTYSMDLPVMQSPITETILPRRAVGTIFKIEIPTGFSVLELVECLNGYSTPNIMQECIAKLVDGCYWVPVIHKSPTAVEVVSAFMNGEYNND